MQKLQGQEKGARRAGRHNQCIALSLEERRVERVHSYSIRCGAS
jgi:hypothetical protein